MTVMMTIKLVMRESNDNNDDDVDDNHNDRHGHNEDNQSNEQWSRWVSSLVIWLVCRYVSWIVVFLAFPASNALGRPVSRSVFLMANLYSYDSHSCRHCHCHHGCHCGHLLLNVVVVVLLLPPLLLPVLSCQRLTIVSSMSSLRLRNCSLTTALWPNAASLLFWAYRAGSHSDNDPQMVNLKGNVTKIVKSRKCCRERERGREGERERERERL